MFKHHVNSIKLWLVWVVCSIFLNLWSFHERKSVHLWKPDCVPPIYGSVGTCCPKDWFLDSRRPIFYFMVKGIRHWHRVIRISEQGITTPKGKLLLWNKILYCQYVVVHGRYTHVDLFLRTNHNYNERIHLNDYFCNHRELRAAIAFYSRGKVELESKEEF